MNNLQLTLGLIGFTTLLVCSGCGDSNTSSNKPLNENIISTNVSSVDLSTYG